MAWSIHLELNYRNFRAFVCSCLFSVQDTKATHVNMVGESTKNSEDHSQVSWKPEEDVV